MEPPDEAVLWRYVYHLCDAPIPLTGPVPARWQLAARALALPGAESAEPRALVAEAVSKGFFGVLGSCRQ